MGPLLYFGALGVVLGAIWLFQNGSQASAAEHHVPRSGNPEAGGGGGGELLPGVAGTPYTYSAGESPAPDAFSPYGGSTDSSAATATATAPAPGAGDSTYGWYPPEPSRSGHVASEPRYVGAEPSRSGSVIPDPGVRPGVRYA